MKAFRTPALLRLTWAQPSLSFAVVATMAAGICASTLFFSVFWSVLFRSLPYPHAERIVTVGSSAGPEVVPGRTSLADTESWREGTKVFSSFASFWPMRKNLRENGSLRPVSSTLASSEFFAVFAVQPMLGRTPVARAEGNQHGEAVLSYGLWVTAFGKKPDVLGKGVQLEGKTYSVVGVMPPEFVYPGRTDIWLPLASWNQDNRLHSRGGRYLLTVGRLRTGVTLIEAQAALDVVSTRLASDYPATNEGMRAYIFGLRDSEAGNIRPYLNLMLTVVGCLLLICCANVAGLSFARWAARRQEIAIRFALGASRFELLRQMLVESLAVAMTGGALGLLLSWAALPFVRDLVSPRLPSWVQIEADWRVLSFGAALTAATSILSVLIPAVRAVDMSLFNDLRMAGAGSTSWGSTGFRRTLVIGQVAISMILLVVATLLSRSLLNLNAADLTLQPDNVVVAHILPQRLESPSGNASERVKRIIEALAVLPGVGGVGGGQLLPFTTDADLRTDVSVSIGEASSRGQDHVLHNLLFQSVTPGYFESLRIPLLQGRLFDARDTSDTPPAVVISGRVARSLWPGRNPLGQNLTFGDSTATVAGVVADVKYSPFESGSGGEIYFSYLQYPASRFLLFVRTEADAKAFVGAIRQTILETADSLAIVSVQPMESVRREFLWRQDLGSMLASAIAIVALVLVAAGIFGLVSFVTRSRTREIGIRAALGATTVNAILMVLIDGLRLVAVGLLVGIPAAWAVNGYLGSLLFGVAPTDLSTFLFSSLFLAVLALVSCALPAVRAATVDPAVALRAE